MMSAIIVKLLHYYAVSSVMIETWLQQGIKTWNAVVSSFSNEPIFFIETLDKTVIGVRRSSLLIPKDTPIKYKWLYCENVFHSFDTNTKTLEFPWISLSLYKGETEVADLTEWLETKKYTGLSVPTFDVVIQAWMNDTNTELGNFEEYSVKLLNELVEEEVYKLMGEVEKKD
jgi:hypothetical protein